MPSTTTTDAIALLKSGPSQGRRLVREGVIDLIEGEIIQQVCRMVAEKHYGKGYRHASVAPRVEGADAELAPPGNAVEDDDQHKERFTAYSMRLLECPNQAAEQPNAG